MTRSGDVKITFPGRRYAAGMGEDIPDHASAPVPDVLCDFFERIYYGVRLTWVGAHGGIIAHGHVPFVHFIAAGNRMARAERGWANLRDDRTEPVSAVLAECRHVWAVIAPGGHPGDAGDGWQVRWDEVTEGTRHALPATLFWPAP